MKLWPIIGALSLLTAFCGFVIGWESRGNGDIVLPAAGKWGGITGQDVALVRYFCEPQDAIDAAESGDVVMLKPGTYIGEPFVVRRPLQICKPIIIDAGWREIVERTPDGERP